MNTTRPTNLPTSLATQTVPLALVLLAVDGLHFVFARALRDFMHPVASAFFVIAVAVVEIGLYSAWSRGIHLATLRRHWPFFLSIGALVATSTALTYTAVLYIDPGTASLLAQTTPLFGVVLGIVWLHERLTRTQLVGALVCLVGVAVITFQPGDFLRVGALLVLTSSAFYATHAALVKKYGGGIPLLEFLLWRMTATAAVLLAAASAMGVLTWPSGTAWLLLALTGSVDVVISRALYYQVLRRLKVSVFSLIMTLSPVVAILWSLFLFGTQPSPPELLGGVAVLLGVALVTVRR